MATSSEDESLSSSGKEQTSEHTAQDNDILMAGGAQAPKESEESVNDSDSNQEGKIISTFCEIEQCAGLSFQSEKNDFVAPRNKFSIVLNEPIAEKKVAVVISSPTSFEPFTELIDRPLSDTEEISLCPPVSAEDLFSNRSEIVMEKNSELFRELKDSQQFIEKWCKCKLISLKIPFNTFTAPSSGCKCGPFTLEEADGRTYSIKACLPIVDGSLCLGVGVDLSDESAPCSINKLVIYRIEKHELSQENSSCDDEAASIDKAFSFSNTEGGKEGHAANSCGEKKSLCMGLKFISINDLRGFIDNEGNIQLYFLFLPLEANNVPNVNFEDPVKVCDVAVASIGEITFISIAHIFFLLRYKIIWSLIQQEAAIVIQVLLNPSLRQESKETNHLSAISRRSRYNNAAVTYL